MPNCLKSILYVCICTGLLGLMAEVQPASAAIFTIPNGDVAGLIAAINTANGNGQANTINLAQGGTYTLTAVDNNGYWGATGLPPIIRTLTINGNGATVQRDSAPGTPDFRIILTAGDLTLDGVTIRGGRGGGWAGAGILSTGLPGPVFGKLLLRNSTVTQNDGSGVQDGGGVSNFCGYVTIVNSTISNNRSFSGYGGGGVLNFSYCPSSSTVYIVNSTIFENRNALGRGDAIADGASAPGSIILKNTIVASPTTGVGDDCYNLGSVLSSLGHNIASDASCSLFGTGDLNSTDPLLGPLASNGGPTPTHVPLSGSPAMDAVPLADCTDANGAPIATDQRGVPRPQGLVCDIGSVEIQSGAPKITEYPVGGGTRAITTGPDGALWFTEQLGSKIGRITTGGVMTEYPQSPLSTQFQSGITTGSDGALWFTDIVVNKIGRITTAGAVTEYSISTPNSAPYGIAAGSDGNLWFTENGGTHIGRIDTNGIITEYSISTGSRGITAGPDGALWFTEAAANKIGRITTTGLVKEYLIPTPGSLPTAITAGPDGALWFTETAANKIGRITTAGVFIAEYSLPSAGNPVGGITAGPDGALWFTETAANKIGRITTAGVITEYPLPTFRGLYGITAGPDGAVWFTELDIRGGVGRITTPQDAIPPDTAITSAVDGTGAPVANSGATLSNSITFTFVGSDNVGVAGFQCSLDVGALASCASPVSYSAVAIGGHTFQVRALDISGNMDPSPASFTWAVVTPAQAVQNLINTISTMGLPGGVANSLIAPLKNIDPNNLTSACNKLDAFINMVGVKLQNGDLTQAEANQLLGAANAIKASLGC